MEGRVGVAHTVMFTVRDGTGQPLTGQAANLTPRVRALDTATDDGSVPAIAEIGTGRYSLEIRAAFSTAQGAGKYGWQVEFDNGAGLADIISGNVVLLAADEDTLATSIALLETEASASSRAAADIAAHGTTQTAVAGVPAAVDVTLTAAHGAGAWTTAATLQLDLRQSWAPALTPAPLTMKGIIHLEANGERVDLPDPGAACTFQGYLADGTLIAGFSGSGTLVSDATHAWFDCSATLAVAPAAGQTIIVRATITGSGVGGGTHNGETAISFPEF